MRTSTLIMVIAMIVCTASLAVADNPPTWRGSAGTTFQQWTFSTNANPAAPEVASNPGVPSAAISLSELATGWWDSFPEVYGSAQGLWDIGVGSITLSIPNTLNTAPDTYKDIQIWVKYWSFPSAAPGVQVSPTADLVSRESVELEPVPPMGGWWADTWVFHLEPNPDFETIVITADPMWGSQIDEIIVDTKCGVIPEPGSLLTLLAAVGGMAGYAVRRRRA